MFTTGPQEKYIMLYMRVYIIASNKQIKSGY